MNVLGIRFCHVSKEAEKLAEFLHTGLGMDDRLNSGGSQFGGAIFPVGESWIEVWPEGPEMPSGTMLQIVVDDADAFAEHAKQHGWSGHGPNDAHGERIYFFQAPGGLAVTVQSKS